MSMKNKSLTFSFLMLLMSVVSPINSFAATEGCPDKWTIDASKYPNEELLQAKQRLGFNMALSEQRKLINFKGSLGDMPKVAGFRTENLSDPLAYLYVNSQVQIDVKVEVKGCAIPGNFRFLTNWFKGFEGDNSPFKEISSEDFANNFPKIMGDFQKQKEFSPYIYRLQNELKKVEKVWSLEKVPSNWAFELIQVNRISRVLNIRNQWSDRLFTYVRTPNCLAVDSDGSNSYDYQISRDIKQCSLSIGYIDWNGGNQTVYLFDSIEFDLANKNSSITCIKGEVTKRIVGINPKCPSGYKKKL